MTLERDEISIFNPRILLMSSLITGSAFLSYRLYRSIQPIHKAYQIPKSYFRKKTLYGKVVSVGDGDNFHLFHTPGGLFTGWNWLRYPPQVNQRGLKGKTLHIRLCGVDAPERSHFGKPAQPYSEEALSWLKSYILGKFVRVKPLSLDRYGRVVCKVTKYSMGVIPRNVSLEMIKRGIGVVYESKSDAEFDGDEKKFKTQEKVARKSKKGLWKQGNKLITPGEYKRKY
ncbi:hypothetical protein WICMUC_004105 [Wickerhamomyces mucosus]|uniref:Probable endonuclease LCL3 n=1 Tax=Wickerhamomyces mucosus TaxID=1378264 RepID=A0A9P8PJT0_9ASCO|nr:hypothetical protein WICMUC_004105 [Wickerhamomyces mucosus]